MRWRVMFPDDRISYVECREMLKKICVVGGSNKYPFCEGRMCDSCPARLEGVVLHREGDTGGLPVKCMYNIMSVLGRVL